MPTNALIIVESDPRLSGRAAEAVRIAAGVAAWKKVEVALYLRGPAVLALSEWTDALADGEDFARYLPVWQESGGKLKVQKGAPLLGELGRPTVPFEEVTETQLAALAAGCRCVLRF